MPHYGYGVYPIPPIGIVLEDSPRAFLISEAVRGERAHLLGKDGKRFMVPIHELAELAPRDIVARSIFKQMIADGMPYVTLSLKHLDPEMIVKRFPGIYAQCKEFGYDLTQEIPVAPAAHYWWEAFCRIVTAVQMLSVCMFVARWLQRVLWELTVWPLTL